MGSGMLAFLIIPSICVSFSPTAEGLVLKKTAITRDVGFYGISLVVLLVALHNGGSNLAIGLLLLLIYACYIGVLLWERMRKV